ncbi:glycosyltransferase [Microbacterium sp. X-17]|uniref:glycosyltransferase n=1 Tax=Microbacterium sp. X-17 TaxID=3144404 RepID=UPI0031F4A991
MRIAQLLLSPRVGGAEALADSLDAEWRALGHDPAIHYLDPPGTAGGRLARLRRMRRLARDHEFDVVVAHSFLPALYSRAAFGGKVPVHYVLHSAGDDYAGAASQIVERALLRRTASVIAVSDTQLQVYRSHFPQARLTTVIRNGVSGSIVPRTARAAEPARVVTISRVARQKRPDVWRRSVEEARHTMPSLAFEWWGPLSGDPGLDSAFENLPPNAAFRGPTTDVASVLATADIVLHTSEREAHSIALVEAAVSGAPIVYADSVNSPELHPPFAQQFRIDVDADATRILAKMLQDWDQVADAAVANAPELRRTSDATAVARTYVEWFDSARPAR